MKMPFYQFIKFGCLIVGLVLVFVVPPFQAPDEPNHFYRINQIANGEFFGTVDTAQMEMGAWLPKSLATVADTFETLIFQPDRKTSRRVIFTKLAVPLRLDDRRFYRYPNTARYAPLAYAPQAIVVALANALNINPLASFYLARLILSS